MSAKGQLVLAVKLTNCMRHHGVTWRGERCTECVCGAGGYGVAFSIALTMMAASRFSAGSQGA